MFGFIVFAVVVYFVIKTFFKKQNKPVKQKEDEMKEEVKITFSTNLPSYAAKQYSEEFIKQKNFQISKKGEPSKETLPASSIFETPQNWELHLKIMESRSVVFKRLLPSIKKLASFKEYYENDIKIFQLSFKSDELSIFKKIYDKVKNLKGVEVYIYGDLVEKQELAKMLRCAVDRNQATEDFCYGVSRWTFNPFGCHRITTRSLGDNAWYKNAYMENGIVYINKKMILEKIKNELKRYRYCPYLDPQRIWNNFVNLPETISLDDENFAIILTLDGKIDVLNRWDIIYSGYADYKSLKEEYGDRLLSRK